jgi:hypothetical protein
MAAVMNGVKTEDVVHIKDEPDDVGSPMSALSEEVEEEDTGELAMPKDDRDYEGVFLARVPKELWQGLVTAGDSMDEPIRIGTVKAWSKPGRPFPEVGLSPELTSQPLTRCRCA